MRNYLRNRMKDRLQYCLYWKKNVDIYLANKEIYKEMIINVVKDELNKILINSEQSLFKDDNDKPHVILLIGVNGSGKTTTAGKIASMLNEKNKKVVIAACDTFRAAAVEQLEQWALRTKSLFFKGSNSSDAA